MKPEQAGKTRILIVDDHALFCEGLVRLLETEPDFAVVGYCATVDEALRILHRKPVDVVLLDFDLGLQRGSEFLSRVRERNARLRVMILTAGLSDLDAAQMIQDGAAGIFLKHGPLTTLAKSIRKVMSGEPWIDSRYLSALLRPDARALQEGRGLRLTERERSVLRGVFQGLGNKEIADHLKISEASVKAALQQLFQKAGVRTRGQLVRVALERYRDQLGS